MKQAQFIGGGLFWDMFLAYRILWASGRFGAGKTSLAVLVMARLLAEKRISRVISNIPLSFASPIDQADILDIIKEKKAMIDTGILLDEAWIYVEDRKSVLDYAGFVRKFNHFLALPSVFPIHPRLSFFSVQRIFNGYSIGLPAWFYKWTINNRGVRENGHFAVYHPVAVFGSYPSDYVPGDDARISEVVALSAQVSGFKGTRKSHKKKEEGSIDEEYKDNSSMSNDLEQIEDVVYQLDEAKEDISKMVKQIKNKR